MDNIHVNITFVTFHNGISFTAYFGLVELVPYENIFLLMDGTHNDPIVSNMYIYIYTYLLERECTQDYFIIPSSTGTVPTITQHDDLLVDEFILFAWYMWSFTP